MMMRVKIFDRGEKGSPLNKTICEEQINDWLKQDDVVSIKVIAIDNLLIIFYKSFVPKC